MNNKRLRLKIFENLFSFIIAGSIIVLLLSLFALFFYVVIWGAIIGGVLWLATIVKTCLSPNTSTKIKVIKKGTGRIIEHNDKK